MQMRVNRLSLSSVNIAEHLESGSVHRQPAYPGKVVTAKAGCGLTGNQAGNSPLDEGFFHGLVNHN